MQDQQSRNNEAVRCLQMEKKKLITLTLNDFSLRYFHTQTKLQTSSYQNHYIMWLKISVCGRNPTVWLLNCSKQNGTFLCCRQIFDILQNEISICFLITYTKRDTLGSDRFMIELKTYRWLQCGEVVLRYELAFSNKLISCQPRNI